MRTENWAILLCGFLIPLFVLMFWHTNAVSSQTYNDTRYENILSNADQTAVSMAEKTTAPVFNDETSRDEAVKAFTDGYNAGFDYGKMRENRKDYDVPFLLLVDTDGYYVNYTRSYSSRGAYLPDDTKRITSPLQTWGKTYGDYKVRFYLNDRIAITDKDGNVKNGTREEVYNAYQSEAQDSTAPLWFLHNDDSFLDEKTSVVLGTLEKEINYYVKHHNDNNKYRVLYQFHIPTDLNGYNARYLNEPSVISFVQGYQMVNGLKRINTFALTGATLQEAKLYDIEEKNGILYYHEKNCADEDSSHVTNKGVTMREAAEAGAYPASCVK